MIELIHVHLYRTSVICFVESSEEEYKKWFEENKPKVTERDFVDFDDKFNDSKVKGFCFETEQNDYIVYVSDKTKIELIVHELFHAANMILQHKGYVPDDIGEPLAYLLEYLVKEFNSTFNPDGEYT